MSGVLRPSVSVGNTYRVPERARIQAWWWAAWLPRASRCRSEQTMTPFAIRRVTPTPEAEQLIERLVQRHGPVAFVQFGDCKEGGVTACLTRAELLPSDDDVKIGEIAGAPFYVNARRSTSVPGAPHVCVEVAPGAAEACPSTGSTSSISSSAPPKRPPRSPGLNLVSGAAVGQRAASDPWRRSCPPGVPPGRAGPRSGGRSRARPSDSRPPRVARST